VQIGPAPRHARDHLVHEALPYASADELMAAAVPFLREGVRAGEQALIVTGAANLRLLRQVLEPDGLAADLVDSRRWHRFPARSLAACDRYIKRHADRGRRVRVVFEPVWAGRTPLEVTEWKRYESVLNVAFAGSGAWLLCPYDTTALDPSLVVDALRTHPWVRSDGERHPSAEYVDPAAFSAACDAEPLAEPPADAVGVRFAAKRDLGAVRTMVGEAARAAGLGLRRVPEAVLAVHEIASNAILHGSGRGLLRTWVAGGELLFQVSGNAPIRAPFPGQLPPRLDTEGGRGLWLARQLCELLQVRSTPDGSVIRLHFALPRRGRPAAQKRGGSV
jgi:MEDS: MEthanogen/methylotroph, DcmR Sensory domain/Histidine kinase-like ATPase domain